MFKYGRRDTAWVEWREMRRGVRIGTPLFKIFQIAVSLTHSLVCRFPHHITQFFGHGQTLPGIILEPAKSPASAADIQTNKESDDVILVGFGTM
jgi:hypothetical protein